MSSSILKFLNCCHFLLFENSSSLFLSYIEYYLSVAGALKVKTKVKFNFDDFHFYQSGLHDNLKNDLSYFPFNNIDFLQPIPFRF